jgi:hypothetical protein
VDHDHDGVGAMPRLDTARREELPENKKYQRRGDIPGLLQRLSPRYLDGAVKLFQTVQVEVGSGPGAAKGGEEGLLAGVVLRERPAHSADTDGRSRWRFHLHWGDVSTSGAQDGARNTGSRRTVLRVEGAWRRRLTREKIGNERGCFGKPYKRTGTVFKSQPDLSLPLVRLRWQPRCGARGREEVRS